MVRMAGVGLLCASGVPVSTMVYANMERNWG